MMLLFEKEMRRVLEDANIEIGGNRDWDIHIKNKSNFNKIFLQGEIGFGESYVKGYFECKKLDELIYKLLCKLPYKENLSSMSSIYSFILKIFINPQNMRRATKVAKKHYDIQPSFFKEILDKRMIYSCGYWHNTTNLDEAQEKKLDLIAQKLEFYPGMKVLDIGCGWGGSAAYFSEKYKVQVVGITISEKQYKYAVKNNSNELVSFILCDYRTHCNQYDAIYSIGMFEHVGEKNYSTFFQCIKKNLKPKASFLLHTIGGTSTKRIKNTWISRYIFPNGELPSQQQITQSVEKKFIIDDWHNFGCYYDTTLMAWHKNFIKLYPNIKCEYYDEKFFRTWCFYLLSCAAAFRARSLHVWQILLTPTDSQKIPFDIPKYR